jgi:hypothetical protein
MYRLSIWLIAFAFVFNGAASYAWIDPDESPAMTIQDDHDAPMVRHDAHAKHAGDDVVAAADHDQAPAHSVSRCCNACNAASVMPDIVAIPVTFSYRAVTFHTHQHDLVGLPAGLDPGIPKAIV